MAISGALRKLHTCTRCQHRRPSQRWRLSCSPQSLPARWRLRRSWPAHQPAARQAEDGREHAIAMRCSGDVCSSSAYTVFHAGPCRPQRVRGPAPGGQQCGRSPPAQGRARHAAIGAPAFMTAMACKSSPSMRLWMHAWRRGTPICSRLVGGDLTTELQGRCSGVLARAAAPFNAVFLHAC